MPSAFDGFMPRTAIQFPNGALLTVGTVSCDDQVHQAVYLSYAPAVAVPNVTGGSVVRSAAYAFLRRRLLIVAHMDRGPRIPHYQSTKVNPF